MLSSDELVAMKLVTKIAVGVLLGFGALLTIGIISELADHSASAKDKQDGILTWVVLGLPAWAGGGWMIYRERQQQRQAEHDRLRQTFFRLLKEGNGHLTALQFAMETGLTGKTATAYLDERAKEFQATFSVSEAGQLSYYFDLSPPQSKRLEEY